MILETTLAIVGIVLASLALFAAFYVFESWGHRRAVQRVNRRPGDVFHKLFGQPRD